MTTTNPKPASVVETLRAARALIEDPKHWTKGALAKPGKRSADEETVNVNDPIAGAWCAVGAITRVDGAYESLALIALAKAIGSIGTFYPDTAKNDIIYYNDLGSTRHRGVMRAFDKAIALAEQATLALAVPA